LNVAQIIPIRLGITKAFLVKDDGVILIDTGCPKDENRIVAALQKENVAPRDLKLILHTHAHYDHCGSTRKLMDLTGAPAALHQADIHLAARGMNDPLKPISLGGYFVQFISYRPFEPFTPDVVIEREMDLRHYGVGAKVIFTPGHTAGSISVLFDDGRAIVGDLMVGGYLGSFLLPSRPGFHWFADDVPALRASIKKVMSAGAVTVYTAHGGPLERDAIMRRFG
jgi:hydroxyacylglutathione hydrolase